MNLGQGFVLFMSYKTNLSSQGLNYNFLRRGSPPKIKFVKARLSRRRFLRITDFNCFKDRVWLIQMLTC